MINTLRVCTPLITAHDPSTHLLEEESSPLNEIGQDDYLTLAQRKLLPFFAIPLSLISIHGEGIFYISKLLVEAACDLQGACTSYVKEMV